MADLRTPLNAALMGHMANHDHRHKAVQENLQDAFLAGVIAAASIREDEELVLVAESIAYRLLQNRD